jgi:hypothetical protein
VAATFTGATALATALTPAFATAGHASSLRERPCSGRPTWVHLRHDGPGTGHNSYCWGYEGGRSLNPPEFADRWCGGNNYGFLIWYAIAGPPQKSVYYRPGTTFAWPGPQGAYSEVVGVHISRWAGTDKCP